MAAPEWLWRARQAAALPPLRPRVPLVLSSVQTLHRIGSIEPVVAARMRRAGLPVREFESGFRIEGDGNPSLAALSQWLRDEGMAPHWRDELLAVVDESDRPVGTIERGVARVLGLKTAAVHLVVRTMENRFWVQQRALDKATDPGQWDTTMGGQVAAGESIAATLERETMEEAGLVVADLHDLTPLDSIEIRRPVDEGYMVEFIDVFGGIAPAGLVPVNRDGEVERFECCDETDLVARLAAGAFTLEATLILGALLERRDEVRRR
jgi:8-oxo-dGTP pyrophosphatase MutT (NUDIX family)